ncbi:MAG: hypothetical protein ACRD1T_20000 [Acidimicrobiia bacterium]
MNETVRRGGRATVAAGLGGVALIVPLIVLELVTASALPRTRFPALGFVYLWVLAVVALRAAVGSFRVVRAPAGEIRRVSVLPRLGVVAVFGWGWVSLVVDQFPCFLGGSGC